MPGHSSQLSRLQSAAFALGAPGTLIAPEEVNPVDADALTFAWWDPRRLADGLVADWEDRKGGHSWTAAGTARPTKANNSLDNNPGVTADGSTDIMVCSTLGAKMATLGAITVIFACQSTSAGLAQIWEHTTSSATQVGGCGVSIDGSANNFIFGRVRGASGSGLSRITQTLQSQPRVISVGLNLGVAAGVSFIRVNGVPGSLTAVLSAATAGLFANANMHLFARSGPAAGTLWAATLGDFALREGVAQDARLTAIESYFAQRAGV